MISINEFDYNLPKNLIAYRPSKRGKSRLLILDRWKKTIEESITREIPNILKYPAVIVRNTTKVVKTRFFAFKDTGAKIEFLVLNPYEKGNEFKSLIKRSSKLKINDVLKVGNDAAVKLIKKEENIWSIRIETDIEIKEYFNKYGHTPLPPYIKRKDEKSDENTYQTVYANEDGSSAAPTAGLHFSKEMLKQIKVSGGTFVDVLLHVGLGTFEPIKKENIEEHKMHSEYFSVDKKSAMILTKAKQENIKIFSIGTTTLRVLETIFEENQFHEKTGMTDIFIYPPYKIKSADILLTNFHLPKSTLLMLVSAFAGKEFIMDSYKYAIEKKFRFFSYGDAMLIL